MIFVEHDCTICDHVYDAIEHSGAIETYMVRPCKKEELVLKYIEDTSHVFSI